MTPEAENLFLGALEVLERYTTSGANLRDRRATLIQAARRANQKITHRATLNRGPATREDVETAIREVLVDRLRTHAGTRTAGSTSQIRVAARGAARDIDPGVRRTALENRGQSVAENMSLRQRARSGVSDRPSGTSRQRGPAGRVRNFGRMSPANLLATVNELTPADRDDAEVMQRLDEALRARMEGTPRGQTRHRMLFAQARRNLRPSPHLASAAEPEAVPERSGTEVYDGTQELRPGDELAPTGSGREPPLVFQDRTPTGRLRFRTGGGSTTTQSGRWSNQTVSLQPTSPRLRGRTIRRAGSSEESAPSVREGRAVRDGQGELIRAPGELQVGDRIEAVSDGDGVGRITEVERAGSHSMMVEVVWPAAGDEPPITLTYGLESMQTAAREGRLHRGPIEPVENPTGRRQQPGPLITDEDVLPLPISTGRNHARTAQYLVRLADSQIPGDERSGLGVVTTGSYSRLVDPEGGTVAYVRGNRVSFRRGETETLDRFGASARGPSGYPEGSHRRVSRSVAADPEMRARVGQALLLAMRESPRDMRSARSSRSERAPTDTGRRYLGSLSPGEVRRPSVRLEGYAASASGPDPVSSSDHLTEEERPFGVELEFNRSGSGTAVVDSLRAAGIPTADYAAGYAFASHRSRNWLGFSVDNDNGPEVGTPPLKGDDGFNILREGVGSLRGLAREDRLSTGPQNNRGMHVHVEARDLSSDQIDVATDTYHNNTDLIDTVFARNRLSAGYARPGVGGHFGVSGSHAVAVNRTEYGTIEFRRHGSTTNVQRVEDWVWVLRRIVQRAADGEAAVERVSNLEEFLTRLGVPEARKRRMLQRARDIAAGRNPTV